MARAGAGGRPPSGGRWHPDAARVAAANVTRLMRATGTPTLGDLRRRAAEEPEWFWPAVVADLGIPFGRPWTRVLDVTDGPAWTRWFTGGAVNLTGACLDRWADDAATAGRPALVAEDEAGAVRTLTWAGLRGAVARATAALRASGVGPDDACAVHMPFGPEAAIAMYAIARAGARAVPVFSGFGAAAIAARLEDAGVRLVVTAAGTVRRGRAVPVAAQLGAALPGAPGVEAVVVLPSAHVPAPALPGAVGWEAFLARGDDSPAEAGAAADTGAEHPFLVAYTSGTTGRPKGSVHVHGGFLVKVASEAAYALDVRRGEPVLWVTDMGWIMGIFSLVAAHSLGAPLVMYDGAPDAPDPGRLWRLAARHRIGVLGVSPTLVRSLRARGDAHARGHDLSALRVLGSTGEPWDAEPYLWLRDLVGEGTRPVINISGGTEVGAVILCPYPVEPIAPCSVGGPCLGMDADVVDEAGRPRRDGVGELVVRRPWPGMTRGLWGDPDRYLQTYWATYRDVWRHGDWARIDGRGEWFVLGRSDETLNVAGKRLGPSEVESVLAAHPAVREAAAVGVADPVTGEALWCFWSPREVDAADVSAELADRVARELGRPFRPRRVVRVDDLPRTRSGKTMRRVLRAAAEGGDPGDLSTAEDPEVVRHVRARVRATGP